MRVLCVLDSPVCAGDRWLWNYLSHPEDDLDFLVAQPSRRFGRLGKVVLRPFEFFRTALQASRTAKRTRYDVMVAWESKHGLPLAFMRWLHRTTQPPLVILTFAAKPYLRRLRGLVRPWLERVDGITVPSTWEADLYRQQFHLGSRISVCHLGGYDLLKHVADLGLAPNGGGGEPYIFTGGVTDRDYETCLASVADLPVRTIANVRRRALAGLSVPSQVEINDLMPPDAYFPILAGASVVVVPLRPVDHAAGLSLILDAMSAGRPVVCTDVPVAREYVEDGVTGLLVPPGDAAAMGRAVLSLIRRPELGEMMGRAARARYEAGFTFSSFAQRAYEVICRTAGAANTGEPW